MPLRLTFVAAVLLLLTPSRVLAQRYSFKSYGHERGLSNLELVEILQDRTGFLWIATLNGLYRYDGRRFRTYTAVEDLPSGQPETLHESVDGTLWVGGRNGAARLSGDRFEAIDISPGKGVHAIASDNRRLYVGIRTGLLIADLPVPAGHKVPFRLLANPPDVKAYVTSIQPDEAGRIWYGCGRSICLLDGDRPVSLKDWGVPDGDWSALCIDGNGSLWARSETALLELPRGERRFIRRDRGLPSDAGYRKLGVDGAGRLYVPTSEGLARRVGNGWEVIGKSRGLPVSSVECLFSDRERNLWIGTQGAGLARWLGYPHWEHWTEAEGLGHELTWTLKRDIRGVLWAGTEVGISRFDPSRRRWYNVRAPGLHAGRTLALAPAADGAIWIGQNPGGVVRLDPDTGRVRAFGAREGLISDAVNALAFDDDGVLWVGTNGGLYRAVSSSGTLRFVREPIPGEVSRLKEVLAILIDSRRRMWLATWQGLLLREGGRWTRFRTADGLSSDFVSYAAEAPDGSIWIGYYEPIGISQVSIEGETIRARHFTTANGLHSDKVFFLGSDPQGRIWVGTDNGIDVRENREWRHLDRSDGLLWNDCSHNAFLPDPDGSVWIGTGRGLSHFRIPASGIPVRPRSVPAVFTEVSFGGRSVTGPMLPSIPYADRSLRLGFAALTFVDEESVRFRYRLAGVDQGWTESAQNEAYLPNLPHGRYDLEVQATAHPGNWTGPSEHLAFTILPPWWHTWWFRLSVSLSVFLVLRLAWWWRLRLVLHRQRELENAVAERTRKLAAEKAKTEELLKISREAARLKDEFLANMSHEIRTPLNAIIGLTGDLLGNQTGSERNENLRLVQISAQSLLSVINDILDFSKIEAGRMELDAVEFDPAELCSETVRMIEIIARPKRLAMVARTAGLPARVIGDPARLRQILVNLLGNAVKFTNAGAITLEAGCRVTAPGRAVLQIAAKDTGIGIHPDQQAFIFEPFRQGDGTASRRHGGTGLGLSICSKLTALMGGGIEVESEPGKGSTFRFTVGVGLPQECASSARRPVMIPAQHTSRPLRILLAEDNAVNQKVASRLLERAGHTVVCAKDGREAVDTNARESFDVILMDVQMPNMDGFEATAEIRRQQAASGVRTPIVALTANATKGCRERCLEAGMDGYVSKPIRPEDMFAAIEAAALTAGAP